MIKLISTTASSKFILNRMIISSFLLLILLLSVFLNPEKLAYPRCFLHEITGYSCLTCGLSRSFCAMAHFHILESFKFHIAGPILFLAVLILFLKFSFEAVAKRKILIKLNPTFAKILLILFATLWLGFAIVRFLQESI